MDFEGHGLSGGRVLKYKRHCIASGVGKSGKSRCKKFSPGPRPPPYSGAGMEGGKAGKRRAVFKPVSQARVAAGKRSAAKSPWLAHVNRVRAANPGVPYKQILVMASSSYR